MKTIILNGSPKGNIEKSGSYFLAKAFVSGMKAPCEIRAIAQENCEWLIEYIQRFERIIVITPNYIHSIPSGTLEFLYAFPQAAENQFLGFIIQCGYTESSENEIMCRFFKRVASRLGYAYLGTAVKGECAGLAIMPQRFGKLEKEFAQLGVLYEQTGRFDESHIKDLEKPYLLSKPLMWLLNTTQPIGNHIGWHKIMKTNNAFEKRLAMPYLDRLK